MCQVSTYLNQRHLMYFFLNLNLLDYPWISLSHRTTFECALLCKPWILKLLKQPLVARSCCGSPQHLCFLKKPFKNPSPFNDSSLRLSLPKPSITKDSSFPCWSYHHYSLPPLRSNPLVTLAGSYLDHENPRPPTHHWSLLTRIPRRKKLSTPTPPF